MHFSVPKINKSRDINTKTKLEHFISEQQCYIYGTSRNWCGSKNSITVFQNAMLSLHPEREAFLEEPLYTSGPQSWRNESLRNDDHSWKIYKKAMLLYHGLHSNDNLVKYWKPRTKLCKRIFRSTKQVELAKSNEVKLATTWNQTFCSPLIENLNSPNILFAY